MVGPIRLGAFPRKLIALQGTDDSTTSAQAEPPNESGQSDRVHLYILERMNPRYQPDKKIAVIAGKPAQRRHCVLH